MNSKVELFKRLLELRKLTQETLHELEALGMCTADIIEYGEVQAEELKWDNRSKLFTARVFNKDSQVSGIGVSRSGGRALVLATLKYVRNQITGAMG